MAKPKERKKFKKRLLHKYRLLILNEDTFEERVSFKLTRLNVFIVVGFSIIILIALTTILIAYTPLREYIPGYSSVKLKRQATELMFETDSLKRQLDINEQYYASIKKVLTGDVDEVDFNKDSILLIEPRDTGGLNMQISKEDSLLREQVANEDRYNLFEPASSTVSFSLFPPVKGNITEGYDAEEKHYGVDVVVPKNEAVKAAADGTVIFSEWTAETGYVIILDHGNNLISVYKHNASLTKDQGDLVKAGEVIATAGSTGKLSTGPHLHFELWNNGYPVDPTNYISFE
ncbi:M23 family metallopeptidase [Leeuwenhoekiella polynyae]|uniref:Peptidase M23-like protein n=1 Tax=Leeuwenhoekiella polynyae TaxID=1550906 RepID=A0A4Q0PHE4_9FLAO|nr:M23 family metallopeptidase [Leeuwenhoekiella polynyae]RXG26419.1 peptidase M23-like protein [Leeuwenhoekiella polynyae]